MVDGILKFCDVTDMIATEVPPRKAAAVVNTGKAVIVDDTLEDLSRGCMVEETVTVGLLAGPINEQMCMLIALMSMQQQ